MMEDLNNVKNRKKRYSCDICPKVFFSRPGIRYHLRIHSGIKPFVCETCQKAFSFKSYLNLHLRTHFSEKTFVCNKCQKGFIDHRKLKRHMHSHDPIKVKPFPCEVCRKSFRSGFEMRLHLLTHTGEKPYGCEKCQKKFSTKSMLTCHLRIHRAKEASMSNVKSENSEMVGYEDDKKCELTHLSHQVKKEEHPDVYSKERPFVCKICQRGFMRISHMTLHIRQMHNSLVIYH